MFSDIVIILYDVGCFILKFYWFLPFFLSTGKFPFGFVQIPDILEYIILNACKPSKYVQKIEPPPVDDKSDITQDPNFVKVKNKYEPKKITPLALDSDETKSTIIQVLCKLCNWSTEKVKKLSPVTLAPRILIQIQNIMACEQLDEG